ncbi:MAG: GNAT family N-acetyltransferase [Theionarchaea archaeon]|nr:GNAT family N-acetyltransferase [Theionarchaea archaeon]
MTESDLEITEYNPSMAARAAELFSAFNEIWPGGFGGGIPYDEQRVRNWLDDTSAIADLVAIDPDGNIIGYCGLYPHYHDSNAAYISLLGVHPRVLGKKIGKMLLLKALEIAAEKGVQRVDLNTWSGNLKAVPLYKKVGLFWVPHTSVYMQDYLPGLFQIPLAKQWFTNHPDWYSNFKRELLQTPDSYTEDGMEVYTYTFVEGSDSLSASVDRYGWQFSSIERVLDNKRIAVKTKLQSHEIFIGITNALTLEITNETGEDVPVNLVVEPFKGLHWKELFPSTFHVRNGEKIEIAREFVVDSSVTVFEADNRVSEVIKSIITLKDQPLELYTGGKIRPAVTISSPTPYKRAPPGKETTVYLDVINNTQEEITGNVTVEIEGHDTSYSVMLSPQQVSGITIPVNAPLSGYTILHVTPSVEIDNAFFLMPMYTYSVVADAKDVATVVKGTNEKELVLLTDFVTVSVEREGGKVRITSSVDNQGGETIDFEVGPPFGLSLDRSLSFDYDIRDDRYLTMVLTAESIHVPGIEVRKYVRIAPGLHEVEFWVELINTSDGLLPVAGKMTTGGGKGIHIDISGAKRRVFTPVRGNIIESDPSFPIMSETMVPQEQTDWEESWTAGQHLNKSDFFGWIWDPVNIEKIRVIEGIMNELESTTKMLNTHELYEPIHVWYTFSHASLEDMRKRWNQLVGHKEISGKALVTTPPLSMELTGPHLIEKGKTSKKTVEIRFATPYPFPGELQLVVPPGWKGHFLSEEKPKKNIRMPEPEESVLIDMELSVPDTADGLEVIQIHFSGEYELDFDIPFLVIGEKEVTVQEKKIEGHPVLEVSNGVITFTVVTEVGGSMIQVEDSQKRSFFSHNYPEIKPKFFMNYNIGGIQPLLFTPRDDNPFFEPEKTHAEIVKEGIWKGVKVSWTIQNHEFLRGQDYTLTYLTVPDSPVVRMRLEHQNPTDRLVKWTAILVADLELQRSLEDITLMAPGGIQTWTKNRIQKPFMSLAREGNSWVRASKGDQSITFFDPKGSSCITMILDLVEVILGFMVAEDETGPHGVSVAEFAFMVNQEVEKVQEFRRILRK